MPTRRDFVLVALLFVFLGALVKESGENLSERAECLRVCEQARQERSKTGVQESRFRSCYRCLERRKDQQFFTLKRRQRRSSFHPYNCVGATSNDVQMLKDKSEVTVTFGQYENTPYWYANVAWSQFNDPSGHLYATLIRLVVQVNDPNVYCTEVPKNQTFININISSYDYICPNDIRLKVIGLPYKDWRIDPDSYHPKVCQPTPSTVIKTASTDCVGATSNDVQMLKDQSEVTVTFGQYENTPYWYANVTWSHFNDPSGHLYATLIRLVVQRNDPNVYCTEVPKNQTFININISSYDYICPNDIHLKVIGLPYRDWRIDLDSYHPKVCQPTRSTVIKTTLTGSPTPSTDIITTQEPITTLTGKPTQSTKIITALTDLTTPSTEIKTDLPTPSTEIKRTLRGSTTTAPTSITNIENTEESEGSHKYTIKLYVPIASGSGIVIGLVLVLCFLKCTLAYKRRCRLYYPVPSGFDYHVFILFNMEDVFWVKNKLLPLLEERHHLKCCIHYRDFPLGGVFYESMADSVQKSYKIIAVYSRNFKNSANCIYELDLAKDRLLNLRDNSLVIIRIDDIDFTSLPFELRQRTLIDYHTALERPRWISRLIKFLKVPEDSPNQNASTELDIEDSCAHQNATTEQDRDYNNWHHDSHTTGHRLRNTFVRLNSTTSTDTTMTCLSPVQEENEEQDIFFY